MVALITSAVFSGFSWVRKCVVDGESVFPLTVERGFLACSWKFVMRLKLSSAPLFGKHFKLSHVTEVYFCISLVKTLS